MTITVKPKWFQKHRLVTFEDIPGGYDEEGFLWAYTYAENDPDAVDGVRDCTECGNETDYYYEPEYRDSDERVCDAHVKVLGYYEDEIE